MFRAFEIAGTHVSLDIHFSHTIIHLVWLICAFVWGFVWTSYWRNSNWKIPFDKRSDRSGELKFVKIYFKVSWVVVADSSVFSCARLKENRKSRKAQEIYFDWLCFQITGYTDVDAALILRYTKKKIIPTTTIKEKKEKQINKEAIHWRASERKEKQLTIVTLRIYFVSLLTTTRPPLPIHRELCESFFTCCCSPLSCSHCYYLLLFHVYSPPTIFGATAV